MKTTTATPMDCIMCDCPYCGFHIIEANGDLRDLTAGDIEGDGILECPKCKKEFEYTIED